MSLISNDLQVGGVAALREACYEPSWVLGLSVRRPLYFVAELLNRSSAGIGCGRRGICCFGA
jgi:hypothetical protein